MELNEVYQHMLRPGNFTEFSIGALLGFEFTPEMQEQAEIKAEGFLAFLGFLPTENDIVFCTKALHDAAGNAITDANGDPELCGEVCISTVQTQFLFYEIELLCKYTMLRS